MEQSSRRALLPADINKVNRDKGLLFLKLHKVGSSTAAGINAMIARNVARRRRRLTPLLPMNNNTALSIAASSSSASRETIDFQGSCDAQLAHLPAKNMCPRRDKTKSYLWSIVRDPASRVVSRFFHTKVSLNKGEPTDDAAIRFFCSQGDHYMSLLSTVPMKSTNQKINNTRKEKNLMIISDQDRVKYANLIMKEYDFIGVTERMDESAVALSMLLDIPLADVLYLDGKVTGGYGLGQCIYFVPSFINPAVEAYMQTRKFQECTMWDRILHQVANRR
jgi:Sulfotransferase family